MYPYYTHTYMYFFHPLSEDSNQATELIIANPLFKKVYKINVIELFSKRATKVMIVHST